MNNSTLQQARNELHQCVQSVKSKFDELERELGESTIEDVLKANHHFNIISASLQMMLDAVKSVK